MKILSQLNTHNVFNLDKNEKAALKTKRNAKQYRGKKPLARYFAVLPGGKIPPGIWERVNAGAFMGPLQRGHGTIRPIYLYTRKHPTYKRRLPFYKIVNGVVDAQLRNQFRKAFAYARATAK